MKPATTSLRAALRGKSTQATRSLSTSAPAFDEDFRPHARTRTKGYVQKDWAKDDGPAKAVWKRGLESAREFRKRLADIDAQMPLYIPPAAAKVAPPPSAKNPKEATLSTLMAAGAALGHSQQLLAVPFTPYAYGNRSGLTIIDLEQTLPLLRKASALVRDVVKADGVVLFVGTKGKHKKVLDQARERLGDNGYTTNKWWPGTLTNAETYYGMDPIVNKTYLPDLVVLLNPRENRGAIRECTARNVPTVGIIDSDTDPRLVTYPIPANADSIRTVELITGSLSLAGQEGRRMRLEGADKRREREQRDREWRRQAAQA